jgi:ankyrin repeat protein
VHPNSQFLRISPGANADVCDGAGNTALHVALAAGKTDVADKLRAAMGRKVEASRSLRRAGPSDSDVIPGRFQLFECI